MYSRQKTTLALRRRMPAIFALAVAGAMGLLFIVFANAGASASHSANGQLGAAVSGTPTKAQRANQMFATQQALARQDGPKKKVAVTTSSAPKSCPLGPIQTGIGLPDGQIHEDILNTATIAPSASVPFEYVVYAGALMSNHQQGIMIVFRQAEDSCAAKYQGTTTLTTYKTPYQKGALKITRINSGSVSFTIAGGGTGQFNYLTGTYS